MTWTWLVPVLIVFIVVGLPVLARQSDQRRKFLLELKKEDRLIAEARARERELEQKRRELEYREALLELERFDRRTGGPGRAIDPLDPDVSGSDPPDPGRPPS
jgi:hypothetical protein